MKNVLKQALISAITLALLFVGMTPMFALEGDIVMSEDELAEWCEEHDGVGGTVYLGADIVIENGISGGYKGGHIVIDTGAFGLIYNGGSITLYDFEIIGEGVDTPVVTMVDAGPNWGMGNWNNNLAFRNITATGRGGAGGVALRVTGGDGARFNVGMVDYENSLIRSYGEGAVGILLDVPLDIYCFNVEVEGAGSAAISAPEGTTLYYCRLAASGAGAQAVTGAGVTLDTCIATPSSLNTTVINRRFSDVSGKRFYLPVRQHDWIWTDGFYTFWLQGDDGSERKEVFLIEWDMAALDAIDTSVIGEYSIQGSLMPIFDGFGLADGFPLTLTIEVRDPAIPCIGAVWFSDWDGNVATLDLWNEYDPAEGGFILWRSDDEGKTWYDFTSSPQLVWLDWHKSVVEYHYDAITSTIMFCLEIPGVGQSNIVVLYEKDGVPYGDTGGDRTGTDRPGGGDGSFGNNGGNGNNNEGDGKGSGNNNIAGGTTSGEDTSGGADNGEAMNDNSESGTDSDEHEDNSALVVVSPTVGLTQYEPANEAGFANNGDVADNSMPRASKDVSIGLLAQSIDVQDTDDASLLAGGEPHGTSDAIVVTTDIGVPLAFMPHPSPAQPFVSSDSFAHTRTIAGAVAITCFGVLIWLKLRKAAKVAK